MCSSDLHFFYSLLHDVLKKDFNPDNIIKNIKNGKYFLDKWKIRDKTETQTSASPTSKEGMELPLNPIPSQLDNQNNNGSGTKPSTRGI